MAPSHASSSTQADVQADGGEGDPHTAVEEQGPRTSDRIRARRAAADVAAAPAASKVAVQGSQAPASSSAQAAVGDDAGVRARMLMLDGWAAFVAHASTQRNSALIRGLALAYAARGHAEKVQARLEQWMSHARAARRWQQMVAVATTRLRTVQQCRLLRMWKRHAQKQRDFAAARAEARRRSLSSTVIGGRIARRLRPATPGTGVQEAHSRRVLDIERKVDEHENELVEMSEKIDSFGEKLRNMQEPMQAEMLNLRARSTEVDEELLDMHHMVKMRMNQIGGDLHTEMREVGDEASRVMAASTAELRAEIAELRKAMKEQSRTSRTSGSRSRSPSRSKQSTREASIEKSDEAADAIEDVGSAQAKASGSPRGLGRASTPVNLGTTRLPRDDDEMSVQSASNMSEYHLAPSLGLHDLKAAELERYKCDMTRMAIVNKVGEFQDDAMRRHPLIKQLMEMHPDDVLEALETDTDLSTANDWLARMLRLIVKPGSADAANFLSDERELRTTDPELYHSGRHALQRMLEFHSLKTPARAKKHREYIEKHAYMRDGMSDTQIKTAARELRDDWMLLPEHMRAPNDPYALRRLLIEKIPQNVMHSTNLSYSQSLLKELEQHELELTWAGSARGLGRGGGRIGKGGGSAARADTWYSWSQLVEYIATRVGKDSSNVNVANGTKPCYNCGSKNCELGYNNCKKLGECGVKGCACIRGNGCWVKMEKLPDWKKMKSGDPTRKIFKSTLDDIMAAREKRTAAPVSDKAGADGAGDATSAAGARVAHGGRIGGLVCCVRVGRAAGAQQVDGVVEQRTETGRKVSQSVSSAQFQKQADIEFNATPSQTEGPCYAQAQPILQVVPQSYITSWGGVEQGGPAYCMQTQFGLQMVPQMYVASGGGVEQGGQVQSWCEPTQVRSPLTVLSPEDATAEFERRMQSLGVHTSRSTEHTRTDACSDKASPHAEVMHVRERIRELEKREQELTGASCPVAFALTMRPAEQFEGAMVVEMLLDTGADCMLTVSPGVEQYAMRKLSDGEVIEGVGAVTTSSGKNEFAIALVGAETAFVHEAHDMATAGMEGVNINVMSHSVLHEATGALIRYEPELEVLFNESASRSGIAKRQGVYWVAAVLAVDKSTAVRAAMRYAASHPESLHCLVAKGNATRARVQDRRLLIAARYLLDHEQMLVMSKAVDGMDVTSVPKEVIMMINNDEALRRSRHTRPASVNSKPVKGMVLRAPGEVFQCDDVPAHMQCTMTGAWLTFEATDERSSFAYGLPATTHGVDDWVNFFLMIIDAEKAMHHVVLCFKVDATKVITADQMGEIQRRIRCEVRQGGGDDHEFIGMREAQANAIQRRTAAAMFRAKSAVPPVTDGFATKCRMYQLAILNDCVRSGDRATRRQLHTGVAPSIRASPRPLFWTKCSVVAIGQQRLASGYMTETRSAKERTGRVIGCTRDLIELRACDTKQSITRDPVDLDPLDEWVLLMAGVTAGSAVNDAQIQCTLEERAPLMQAKPQVRQTAPRPIVQYAMPGGKLPLNGSVVQMLWQDHKGDAWRYHDAVVVDIDEGPPTMHCLEHVGCTGRDKRTWHDLAKEHATGSHPWRVKPVRQGVSESAGQENVENAQSELSDEIVPRTRASKGLGDASDIRSSTKQGGPVTRARAHAKAVVDTIDNVVGDIAEYDPLVAGIVWDQCMYDAFGDGGDRYHVCATGSLTKARIALYKASRLTEDVPDAPHVAAVSAATAGHGAEVEIVTETGEKLVMRPPRNDAELMAAPDSTEWMIAERSAFFDSIVRLPGNMVVGVSDVPREERDAIEHFVTVRKYKVVDGELKKRKVRHSLDEARSKRKASPEKREEMELYATYTMPVGELESNIFLATVEPDDVLACLDWTDAYGIGDNAHRSGEAKPRFVWPPKVLDVRTETGEPGVLRMVTSIWGEGPAGNDFEAARNEDMTMSAWPPVHDVPASFYNGDDRAVVIIDDLLVRAKEREKIERLAAALSKRSVARGGQPITIDWEPVKWGGMKLQRCPERITLTSSMPEHILASTHKWIPSLAQTGIVPGEVLQGKALRNALDALQVARPRPARPCRVTRQCMQLVGDLRWMCKRVIRIIKHSHMLSLVANAPKDPDATLRAALGVLALAYIAREEGRTWGGSTATTTFVGALKGTVSSVKGSTIRRVDGGKKLQAPKEMEGTTDTTWSRIDEDVVETEPDQACADVYTHALTLNGAAVHVELKRVHIVTGSSAELEGFGLLKLSDNTVWARLVAARYGVKLAGPTLLMCDAEASLRTAAGRQASARLRHALRRAAIVTQRIREADIELAHLPDAANYVDMFTKWLSPEKVERSIAYLSGALARSVHLDQGASTTSVIVAALSTLHGALQELTMCQL